MRTCIRISSFCPCESRPDIGQDEVEAAALEHFQVIHDDTLPFAVLVTGLEPGRFVRMLAPPQHQSPDFCYWRFPSIAEAGAMRSIFAAISGISGAGFWTAEYHADSIAA